MEKILELKNITKNFGNTRALNEISFSLDKGKIYGLVGENGAGKSTLVKIISGGLKSDNGGIYYKEQIVINHSPRKAKELGISIVHQWGDLAPNLSVLDNIFLGNEERGFIGILNRNYMQEKAHKILKEFDLDLDLNLLVEELSPAYQQIVTITKALLVKNEFLIIDEGGASLDKKELVELFAVLRKLKCAGVTIIYISHLLDNVIELSDEIIILRDGNLIKIVKTRNIILDELASLVIGCEVKTEVKKFAPLKKDKLEKLKVDSLMWKGGNIPYSFAIKESEILGITGPSGSGKSELLRTIMGFNPKEKGTMWINREKIIKNSPFKMIRKKVAFVPESRFAEGLVMLRSMEENITLPNLWKWYNFLLNKKELIKKANQVADVARITRSSIQDRMSYLSGGNQQKTVIAKWLASDYELFLLDEPFIGIDIGAKSDISEVIRRLSKNSCSIILVSTEFTDLIGLVHRLFVMVNHKIVAELQGEEITNKNIIKYYQSIIK
jgi:ABC-type sugar transport system ATPase subunit